MKNTIKLNIRNIARECKVSPATVSKVINDKKYVSTETRHKVLEAINKFKYDPARNMPWAREAKTRLIGFVSPLSPVDTNSFGTNAITIADRIIRNKGYNCVLFRDEDLQQKLKDEFHKGRKGLFCDGFIFFCPHVWEDAIQTLKGWNVPMVLVRRATRTKGVLTIMDNDYKGAWAAMEHLHRLGHRTIGYIGVHPRPGTGMRERQNGYADYVRQHGLTSDARLQLVYMPLATVADLEPRLIDLLHSPVRPTAFFCEDDDRAMHLIRFLAKQNIRVPHDVAVVGYDNTPPGRDFNPSLTSVDIPINDMLDWASRVLFDQLAGNQPGAANIVLENRLVVRESCGARESTNNEVRSEKWGEKR
jgi:DNA-binding LacI/PurR family transcriptional regulator